jgi:hypothetical protein
VYYAHTKLYVCEKDLKMANLKKTWSAARKILKNTAVVFTVTYFLFLCFAKLISEVDIDPAIPMFKSFVLLLFSLFLASADLIFNIPKIGFLLKLVIHFFAVLISTVISTSLAGYDFGYKATLMFFVFVVLYAICVTPYVLIGRKYKKTPSKQSFESIFGQN